MTGVPALPRQHVNRIADPSEARAVAVGLGGRGVRLLQLLFLVQHVLTYLVLDQGRDAHAAVADSHVAESQPAGRFGRLRRGHGGLRKRKTINPIK